MNGGQPQKRDPLDRHAAGSAAARTSHRGLAGRSNGDAGSKRRSFTTISILCFLALAFAALELSLRIVHYRRGTYKYVEESVEVRRSSIWIKSEDSVLVYTHRPNYTKETVRYTESHGILRPTDVKKTREPNVNRIALVGDSIAAGVYLPYDQRLGTQLEAILNQRQKGKTEAIEVLNFGVNGYSTLQEARLVEVVVSAFRPDLLVLQYCMNDTANSLTPTIWFLDRLPLRSHFLDFLSRRLHIRQDPNFPEPPDIVPAVGPVHGLAAYWYRLYDPQLNNWQSVVEGFRRIDAYSRSEGIPVVLVIFPFLLEEPEAVRASLPFHTRVREAGTALGWKVINLLDLYKARGMSNLREVDHDIFHPNALAMAIAARAIAASLIQPGLGSLHASH